MSVSTFCFSITAILYVSLFKVGFTKMDMNVKDLCRLCASKDEFCKDILDENNKNILKLIKDFIQIVVCDIFLYYTYIRVYTYILF